MSLIAILPCQHLSGMFSWALSTPSLDDCILHPGSLLVGTGVHDRHPGKCGAGDVSRMVVRGAPAPGRACAPTFRPRLPGQGMGRERSGEKTPAAHGSASLN